MWKEITGSEFWDIHSKVYLHTDRIDVTDFSDFIEIEYIDSTTKDRVIKRTEQENFDECEVYPSTHRYYKWEK